MRLRSALHVLIVLSVGLGVVAAARAQGQAPAPAQDMEHPQGTNAGIFAFTGNCASCHDTGKDDAPDRYALNRRTPEEVLAKITTGAHARPRHRLTEFAEARRGGLCRRPAARRRRRPATPRR